MRTINILSITFLSFILFTSCEDTVYEKYTANVPIYLEHDQLKSSIKFEGNDEDLKQPGRIYFEDDYIYINEYYEGIHIIDNSDPSNPDKIGFIEIPGNLDLAIKGNILYHKLLFF